MNTLAIHHHERREYSAEAGFTLLELMIAMAISLVAITSMYSLFIGQSRAMRGQQQIVETQENARVAMEVLTRDIRNAGFGLLGTKWIGVRMENNCGAAGHDLGLTGGTSYSTAGSELIDEGDLLRTIELDPCPNGSDRITLVSRPRMDVASACNSAGCAGQTAATVADYNVVCNGSTTATTGDCCVTMEAVCEGCSTACNGGCASGGTEFTFTTLPTVSVCDRDNVGDCLQLDVTKAQCNMTDPSGQLRIAKVQFAREGTAFPATAADWTLLGGKDQGVEVNSLVARTYQLLDVDGDGSTELVFSDKAHTLEPNAPDTENANWVVVANFIDDLQFAYSLTPTPTTFVNNRTLWNIPNGCVPGVSRDCLLDLTAAGGTADDPAAIRVSIISRSSNREKSGSDRQVSRLGRPSLEDHIVGTPPAYDPLAAMVAGPATCTAAANCGCGTPARYETCTGLDANAPGFRRRILTEIVGLRNF